MGFWGQVRLGRQSARVGVAAATVLALVVIALLADSSGYVACIPPPLSQRRVRSRQQTGGLKDRQPACCS